MPWNPFKKVQIKPSIDVHVGPIGFTIEPHPDPAPVVNDLTVLEEPIWERCEVVWDLIGGNTLTALGAYFWAKAIGPQGIYTAAQSGIVPARLGPDERYQVHAQACSKLIAELTAQGWEPVGEHGTAWYSYKFRRRPPD